MAYNYQTGTANDVPHWFSLLETFLVAIGWTVADGTGTTTVVFSSPGELGGRTKLFIRFRRDGATLNRVWFRVQDDVGGTHATTESTTYIDFLDAPGLGAIPFVYFMAADKDKVIVNYKAGVTYTGCYVGIVEPFALTVDEEEQMISINLGNLGDTRSGYVLKDDSGAWDQSIRTGQARESYIKDPLDNSVAVYALRVDEIAFNRIVGQPTDVSGRINVLAGVNPEDIITTGYTGATSTWIVMGTATHRWCMRTGGNVPVGQLEGANFAHTNGLATSQADFEAKLLAFLVSMGWSQVAVPAPAYPIDHFFYSPGESGTDDIYIRWQYQPATRYQTQASDDAVLTHTTGSTQLVIKEIDFPTYYYITGDRDCFLVVLEIAGVHLHLWGGMLQMFLPDPDSIASPYKVGVVSPAYQAMIRDHTGAYPGSMNSDADGYANSSPNLYDGVTNVIWQYPTYSGVNYCPIGVVKYLHRWHGPSLSLMDTAAIGGRSFRYFNTGLAFREV